MCVSKEQINDVVEALSNGQPMMPQALLSGCEIISTYAELDAVVNEMKRRGYVVYHGKGVLLVERLGVCDGCGIVDHHLLGGECEQCRQHSTWVTVPISQSQQAGAAQ